MSATYKSATSWDVGCDDCGAFATVTDETDADLWIEDHVCEER